MPPAVDWRQCASGADSGDSDDSDDALDADLVSKATSQGSASDASGRFDPDDHVSVSYSRVRFARPRRGRPRTQVAELPEMLQWRSQKFRCQVAISLESSRPDADWTIGLVQACDSFSLEYGFGDRGIFAWEFHPLKSGVHRMVNDSNGSQWPFYAHDTSMIDLAAHRPVASGHVLLHYTDFFYPTMQWSIGLGDGSARLSSVSRRQQFKVWLVAIRRGGGNRRDGGRLCAYSQFRPHCDKLYVLQAIEWQYQVDLEFDSLMPLGQRLRRVSDQQAEQPRVLETVDPIPTSAMVPPNCNSSQSLIFYPTDSRGALHLSCPPEETVVSWRRWRQDMTAGYFFTSNFDRPSPPPAVHRCWSGDPALRWANKLTAMQRDYAMVFPNLWMPRGP